MKKRYRKDMDNKYIEIIGKYLENEDEIKLAQICNNLNVENTNTLRIEDIYYTLVDKIENDEEMLEYFKDIAKKNKVYTKLFPYFKKAENIRFFVDNQTEYGLNIDDINKMEKTFKETLNNKRKDLERKNRRTSKKYLRIAYIILFIILTPFTISLFSPVFQTYITKQATITDAIVVTKDKKFSIISFTTNIYWQYEYYVDGVKYINEDETINLGFGPIDVANETIKIYYQDNNPSVSKVYDFNLFIFLDALVINIIVLIGIIYLFKDKE